jgi:hypothetical protein
MYECGVPVRALNLSSASYPDHGRCGDLPLQGKIPTAEQGIESGTSCLTVRSSNHQAARLVITVQYKPNDCTNQISPMYRPPITLCLFLAVLIHATSEDGPFRPKHVAIQSAMYRHNKEPFIVTDRFCLHLCYYD